MFLKYLNYLCVNLFQNFQPVDESIVSGLGFADYSDDSALEEPAAASTAGQKMSRCVFFAYLKLKILIHLQR